MTPCVGVLGWLFGHRFREFLTISYPPNVFKIEGLRGIDPLVLVDASLTKSYTVRCGCAPDGKEGAK